MIYVSLIVFVFFITLLYDKSKEPNIKILFGLIPMLALILISGLRYRTGADYTLYEAVFEQIKAGYQNIRIDYFVVLLDKALVALGFSSQSFFVITSIIGLILVDNTIKYNYKKIRLCYFIFICGTLYFSFFNTTRQCLAIFLFYFSLRYIKEDNLKKYIICNSIGMLIHASSIIFIPFYFISKIDFKKKYFVIAVSTLLGSSFLVKLASIILGGTKYAMYLSSPGLWDAWGSWRVSNYVNLILFLLYYFLITEKDENDKIYMNIHYIGVLISILVTSIPLADRLFISFRFIEFLSIPNLINKININNKYKKIIVILVYMFYAYYFVHNVLQGNSGGVMPYRSIIGGSPYYESELFGIDNCASI